MHQLPLGVRLIIDAQEVQDAMYHHTVQLLLERHTQLLRICCDSVDANEYIAIDCIVTLLLTLSREGYDICVVIMLEKCT